MALTLLCDTSVLIPAMVHEHTHHAKTFPLIQKILDKKLKGLVCAHSLAECLSTLTKLGEPSTPPSQAYEIIHQNIMNRFEVVELTTRDYDQAAKRVAERERRGSAIYDSLILQAALKRKVDCLITWDLKDFTQLAGNDLLIETPETYR